jgi:hypothetical protein
MRRPPLLRSLLAAAPALARCPRVWSTTLRVGLALVPTRWWARWPPLPLPDRDWLAFRWETAYGSSQHSATPDELIEWLEWCREVRTAAGYRLARHRLR